MAEHSTYPDEDHDDGATIFQGIASVCGLLACGIVLAAALSGLMFVGYCLADIVQIAWRLT